MIALKIKKNQQNNLPPNCSSYLENSVHSIGSTLSVWGLRGWSFSSVWPSGVIKTKQNKKNNIKHWIPFSTSGLSGCQSPVPQGELYFLLETNLCSWLVWIKCMIDASALHSAAEEVRWTQHRHHLMLGKPHESLEMQLLPLTSERSS